MSGCNVELRPQDDGSRLAPLIGLLNVLAAWLSTLKYAARDEPDPPASAWSAAASVPGKSVATCLPTAYQTCQDLFSSSDGDAPRQC